MVGDITNIDHDVVGEPTEKSEWLLKTERIPRVATLEDLFFIVDVTQKYQREYGIKDSKDERGNRFFVYKNGSEFSIIPPGEPQYGDAKLQNVFFHTHPYFVSGPVNCSVLVSGTDIGATMLYLAQGGESNIVDLHGFSLFIYSSPMSEGKVVPAGKMVLPWKHALSSRYENIRGVRHMVQSDRMVHSQDALYFFRVDDFVYERFRLFMRIGKNKMVGSGVSLDDLNFGTGLQTLLERFQVKDMPHEKNLHDALQGLRSPRT